MSRKEKAKHNGNKILLSISIIQACPKYGHFVGAGG